MKLKESLLYKSISYAEPLEIHLRKNQYRPVYFALWSYTRVYLNSIFEEPRARIKSRPVLEVWQRNGDTTDNAS